MTSSLMVYRRKKKPQASAVVLRKYRRLRRRRGGLRCEYKKLKALLPETTKAARLKKVGVVEAAYRYICQLQDALLDKFSSKGVPEDLAGVVCGKVTSSSDIQALALHLIRTSGSDFPLPPSWLPAGFGGTPFGTRDPDSTSSMPQRQLTSSKSPFISSTSPSTTTSSAFSPSSSSPSSTSSHSSSPLASPVQSAPANSPSHFFSFTTSNASSASSSISPVSSSSSSSSSTCSHNSFASQETGSSRSSSIPPCVPVSSRSSSFQMPVHSLTKSSFSAPPAQPRETPW